MAEASAEVLFFWPAAALLGFLLLSGVVVVLGISSTTRYDGERRTTPPGHPKPDTPSAHDRATGTPAADEPTEFTPRPVGAENHPAGKGVAEASPAAAWWLVHRLDDGDDGQVVAGPFGDSIDAEWAALSAGLYSLVRAVHGVPQGDSRLLHRTPPPEQRWLAELGE